MRPPVTTISTPWCMASVKARIDGHEYHAPFLSLGSAVHAAAQAASTAAYDTSPNATAVETAAFLALHEWQQGPHALPNEWYMKACESVDTMLGPDSSIWLGKAGDGRSTIVEKTFLLGEEFEPIQTPKGYEWERYGEVLPGVAYAFTVDRLDYPWGEDAKGSVEITDLKNGLVMLKKGEADTPQGRFYSFGVLQHVPAHNAVTWKMALTRHGYTVKEEYTRDDKRLRWARSMMKAKRARVRRAAESGEWTASVGSDCDLCPISGTCRAFSDAVTNGSMGLFPRLSIDAQLYHYLALKTAVASLKRELEKHADTVGPIPLSPGRSWGYHPKDDRELVDPMRVVIEDLRKLGATDEQIDKAIPKQSLARDRLLALLNELAKGTDPIVDDPEAERETFYRPKVSQSCGPFMAEEVSTE